MRSAELICLDLDSLGAVQSLRVDGVEFVAPAAGNDTLFVCRLRDFVGNPLQLEARNFSAVQRQESGRRCTSPFPAATYCREQRSKSAPGSAAQKSAGGSPCPPEGFQTALNSEDSR